MNKIAFLLFSIKNKAYFKPSWFYSVFSVTRESDDSKLDIYPGKVIREDIGMFFYDEKGEKIHIEDAPKGNAPLFVKNEVIAITPEWISSLKEKSLETTIGKLFINLCTLHLAFDDRFPYRNDNLDVPVVEQEIINKLESNLPEGKPRDPSKYYVDEYLRWKAGGNYLADFSHLFTHSITRIGILPPPGRKEFRKKLEEEYKGRLSDPIAMAEFTKRMAEFDDTYLKQDPAYKKFMTKKVLAARQKAYLTYGGEKDEFTNSNKVAPITRPMEEGISTNPEEFVAMANNARYSSLSRGAETVNGGVVAKRLGQATDSWRITKGDCGTKFGIDRFYLLDEVSNLAGRYIILQGKPVLIETDEQAKVYASKKVSVRSPEYCSLPGTQTCEVCAGVALSRFPNGLSVPTTEMSGGILTDSLKKMHQTDIQTEVVDLTRVIT